MTIVQRWTQTSINDLRTRLEKGDTIANIATESKRPLLSVIAMMERLRLREQVQG